MSPILSHPLTIRPAERPDFPVLLTMIEALTTQHGDQLRLDEATLIDLIYAPAPWVRILVAEQRETLVGYAALVGGLNLQFGQKTMDLHHLFVADGQRGKGIGTALIDASREVALRLGCEILTVGTHADNHRAQATYTGYGFQKLTPRGPRYALDLR